MQPIHILLPTDFSEASETVVQFVGQLAARTQVALTLLHLLEVPYYGGSHLGLSGAYAALYQERLQRAEEELTKLSQNTAFTACVKVTTVLETDPAFGLSELVARTANKLKCDLVLTTSKHRSGFEDIVIGSDLLRIIRNCDTPTLCLSAGQLPNVRRLIFATDFSPESIAAFAELMPLMALFDAALYVAYINTPSAFLTERAFKQGCHEFREQLSRTSDREVDEFICYNARTVPDGLIHCAEDHLADLLVMATHARKGFSLMLHGSVTADVLEAAKMPVLILRTPETDVILED